MKVLEKPSFVVIKKNKTKNDKNKGYEEKIVLSTENDLLSSLDNIIIKTLYDVGLDSYLIKEQAFNREKYYNALKKYEELFNAGKISTKENIKATFQYLVFYIKNDLEVLNESEMVIKYIYDYYMAIKDEIDMSQYQYISEFMLYISENELGKQLELR